LTGVMESNASHGIPSDWGMADLPDLTGRTAIVTGATSGIGLVTARALAGRGAATTLAVRDTSRGEATADTIRRTHPGALVEVGRLDLADLGSVRDFAAAWSSDHDSGLDLLINNAGVMALPRRESPDGFEMQLATNHLGHFALTGLLLPALVARPRSRVVTVSSTAHRMGRIDFDDLQGRRRYSAWRAYGQSKLANLLFAMELQRRLDLNGIPTLSLAAHPGYSATNLQAAGPQMRGRDWLAGPIAAMNRVLAQSPEQGALPTLLAATFPGLAGGSYIGPDGFLEARGHPRLVDRSPAARDEATARRLWDISEELTGVSYPLELP
jgi:NAD(P)-dependent dehydrogenase (short-subunit alcohol dehydrogenase family)